jgi:hypothetical protein
LKYEETELEHIQSVENVESDEMPRIGVTSKISEFKKMISDWEEDLKLYEPEKCRLNDDFPPIFAIMHLLVIFVRADIIVSCIRKTKDKNFA